MRVISRITGELVGFSPRGVKARTLVGNRKFKLTAKFHRNPQPPGFGCTRSTYFHIDQFTMDTVPRFFMSAASLALHRYLLNSQPQRLPLFFHLANLHLTVATHGV